jgi:hypothetical protein
MWCHDYKHGLSVKTVGALLLKRIEAAEVVMRCLSMS